MANPDRSHRPSISPLVGGLFSLSGVVSLGMFLMIHVAINARVLRSEAAFDDTVAAIHRVPALALFEWLFVFGPLLFHASVGLWLVATRRSLAHERPYPRTVRRAMRGTGVAAVAFLAMHLPELRLRAGVGDVGGAELATLLAGDLSSTSQGIPWRGIAYLVGAACVTFHFVAGLWGFLAVTRLGAKERARMLAGWGAAAIGGTIWVVLANVVVFHATGARLFGSPPGYADPAPPPCPGGQ